MSIKLCTPLYKEPLPGMRAVVASVGLEWHTCSGPHIWRNRNKLVCGQFTHYLFWDSDIVPADPVGSISSLVARDLPIVGAAYEMRRDDGIRSYCAAVNESGHVSTGTTGLHKVDWVGAGFLVVKNEVFETCPKPWFRHEFVGDDQTPEDIGFCMNARANGFEIYVDCDVVVNHII